VLLLQLLKLAIKTIENEVIQNPETPIASVNIALTEILPVSAFEYGLLSAESLRSLSSVYLSQSCCCTAF